MNKELLVYAPLSFYHRNANLVKSTCITVDFEDREATESHEKQISVFEYEGYKVVITQIIEITYYVTRDFEADESRNVIGTSISIDGYEFVAEDSKWVKGE